VSTSDEKPSSNPKRLMLISNSTQHGGGWLDHCETGIRELLGRSAHNILFIPYAQRDTDAYAAKAKERFQRMGYRLTSIHREANPAQAIRQADAVFVGGGNTYLLLYALCDMDLLMPLWSACTTGLPYIGVSAGANVACPTIRTTNDWPIVLWPTASALNLVPFQINPHFVDANPRSIHQGETREARIAEFHEHNPHPVVGLREGTWIQSEGNTYTMRGSMDGSKIFFRDGPAQEWVPGTTRQF
jgi:dipeptidase E